MAWLYQTCLMHETETCRIHWAEVTAKLAASFTLKTNFTSFVLGKEANIVWVVILIKRQFSQPIDQDTDCGGRNFHLSAVDLLQIGQSYRQLTNYHRLPLWSAAVKSLWRIQTFDRHKENSIYLFIEARSRDCSVNENPYLILPCSWFNGHSNTKVIQQSQLLTLALLRYNLFRDLRNFRKCPHSGAIKDPV